MPRVKREVAELRARAINSLVLGIELFNRPHEGGRAEAVLILLHHAFEMLLKAVIKDRTGVVHAEGDKYTYGFDKCLVAQLRLDTTGEGTVVHLRLKKDAEVGVRIANDSEPVSGFLVKQEVNIWDKYNLGRDDLAKKLGLSGPRTSAVILELGIQDDAECFKILRRKKTEHRPRSPCLS